MSKSFPMGSFSPLSQGELSAPTEALDSQEKAKLVDGMFIILRGSPGSGKTTLAEKIDAKYDITLVDPDLARDSPEFAAYVAASCDKDPSFAALSLERQLYRYNLRQALDSINKGTPVVWTQAWSSYDGIALTIENMHELVEESVALFPTVVELELTPEDSRARVATRHEMGAHSMDVGTFDTRFARGLQPYRLEKPVPYIQLNGNNTLDRNFHYLDGYFCSLSAE
jgi:dephospho-CoA kinase